MESGKRKIRRLEGSFETDSDKSVASQELQVFDDECDNPEHIRLAAENSHLQGQLRRYGDTAAGLILFFESPLFTVSDVKKPNLPN